MCLNVTGKFVFSLRVVVLVACGGRKETVS